MKTKKRRKEKKKRIETNQNNLQKSIGLYIYIYKQIKKIQSDWSKGWCGFEKNSVFDFHQNWEINRET